MALTFIAAIEGADVSSNIAFVTDHTVYGGSNPDRNELAVAMLLWKRDADDQDTAVTLETYNPLTWTQIQFTLPDPDGLFVALFLGFQIWAAGTYNLNDCVYYTSGDAYYIANVGTSGVPGSSSDWTLITDLQSVSGNASLEETQLYMFSTARSQAGSFAIALAAFGPKYIAGKCQNLQEAAQVLLPAALINSSWTNFRLTNYQQSQQIIDYVQAQSGGTF